MKKIIALMTAAVMLTGFAGCEKKTPEPSGATLEVSLHHSYAAKQIPWDDTLGITKIRSFGEKLLLNCSHGTGEEYQEAIVLLDPDTGDFVRKDIGGYHILGMDDCGDTLDVMLGQSNDDGTDKHITLMTYDGKLNELHSEEVTADWDGYVAEFASWTRDAQGNEYASQWNTIICMTPDGTIEKIKDSEGHASLFKGRDGNVYGISPDNMKSIDVYDPETMTAETINIELPVYASGGLNAKIIRGSTQYDYLCYNNEYLYGVDIASGSVEEVLHWESSDFTEQEVFFLPDGRAVLDEFNWDTMTSNLWLLTERTQEEINSMQLISMAMLYPSLQLTELVHRYNRQAQGYHITIRSYDEHYTNPLGGDALERDLLDGIIPDIMAADVDYQKLANKGLFEDLSVWMENDPDFHEEDYLMNLFESMRYKGRLERIAFNVYIEGWAAKSEFISDRMTLSDLLAYDLPEGMAVMGGSDRASCDQYLYSQLGEFIDYEKGTCRFDSPEFIQLMELFGALPEHAGVEDEAAYAENRRLLSPVYLGGLAYYHHLVEGTFGGADVTLTGFPVGENGNGGAFKPSDSLCMLADSLYKEQIWDFFKFCLNQENQMPVKQFSRPFPVRIDAIEQGMAFDQQEWSEPLFYDEVTGPATAEEAEELMAYLRGITDCTLGDHSIQNIISEEVGKYFSGDCTAEEAAKMMQSRASLYLAEQN